MLTHDIHNKGQARLFKNPLLEALTKTHPLVIWGMYLPIMGTMIYYSAGHFGLPGGGIAGLFFSGMFFWTFFEYIMHRFVYHFVSANKAVQRFVYIFHANHHEYPRDTQRLFLPPVPSLLIASALFFSMYGVGSLSHRVSWVFAFYPGFILGYLLYASMHYAIHAWRPPFKWMKPLWRNHQLHHYKQQERGFGVSSTLWDHIFGTMFEPENDAK
jgi:sterol desaturase/sphingolipid hydroxylase (fatty acid hydroxylase superfamily)